MNTETNRQKRKRLWDSQNGQCQYCLKEIPFEESTLDHVKPRSRGGSNDISNLVMSRKPCNNLKKDLKSPRAFPDWWPNYFGDNYNKNF